MPRTRGLAPTERSVDLDKPAPIKKSVTARACFETETTVEVRTCGKLNTEFTIIAKMKKKINHGIEIFFSPDLK